MIPTEIQTILPEMVELARVRRRPIARRTDGWLMNAWVLRSGSTPVVAVVVQPNGRRGPEPERRTEPAASLVDLKRLRDRFGLTRAEVRVARLLQLRYTNREIATALSISPHTARHHTGKILLKLGITRRSEVPSRITEVGTTPDILQ